jgi:hypothetical protein
VLYVTGGLDKPPYRDAMRLVAQGRVEGDAVLHTSDGSYLPALCYVDFANHAVLDGDPDPRKPREVYQKLGGDVWTVAQAVSAGQRLWLIVALEHSVDWQREQAAYFARQYPALAHYRVNGIEITLYDLAIEDRR